MTETAQPSLNGLTALVVEDQFLIAEEHASVLRGLGAQVIGPVKDVASGIEALAGARPDFAVLDVNLGGDTVFALADALANRQVPYLFVTGYEAWAVPRQYREAPTLEKPLSRPQLVRALQQMGVHSSGAGS